jgi:hypothetical protein
MGNALRRAAVLKNSAPEPIYLPLVATGQGILDLQREIMIFLMPTLFAYGYSIGKLI